MESDLVQNSIIKILPVSTNADQHQPLFVSAKQIYMLSRTYRTVPYRVLAHSHSPTSLYNFNYISQSAISLHQLFTSCPHLTCERASFGLV